MLGFWSAFSVFNAKLDAYTTLLSLFNYKCVLDNSGNECVVLENSMVDCQICIEDKTAFESIENHVHLFDGISKKQLLDVKPFAQFLGKSVLQNLVIRFPMKRFRVYVELVQGDSVIVRFHQVWKDEAPYFKIPSGQESIFGDLKTTIFCYENGEESLS